MTELAVLVPVLNRPANVAPLVESFLTGCPADSKLFFICSYNDNEERDEVRKWSMIEGRVDGDTGPLEGTWPRKINYGIKVIEADWYLCAADDITFTPGWWEATKELRDDERIGVIGTNDSAGGRGNPRVAAGEHTCHPLIRATYIRDCGTVDEPGKAVHDGYNHWFVDDELVWTAKLRGAWAFCREAVIEHHHPYWDPNVMWDDTYMAGEANANADAELWRQRAKLLGLDVR